MLFARTAPASARLLLPYLLLWTALRVRALVMAPQIEVNWLAVGEIAVLAAGGWALFADLCTVRDGSVLRFATGERGRRIVRLLFAFSLLAFGLSHFFYTRETVVLVPAWLPFRSGWAYLTGAGHFTAGLGVLLSIYPRLAATMEAAMLTMFTVLVWIPAIVAPSATRVAWWELEISWAIAAGAWVVAGSIVAKSVDSLGAQVGWGARPCARLGGIVSRHQYSSPADCASANLAVGGARMPCRLVWSREEFDRRLPRKASLPAAVVRDGMLLHAA